MKAIKYIIYFCRFRQPKNVFQYTEMENSSAKRNCLAFFFLITFCLSHQHTHIGTQPNAFIFLLIHNTCPNLYVSFLFYCSCFSFVFVCLVFIFSLCFYLFSFAWFTHFWFPCAGIQCNVPYNLFIFILFHTDRATPIFSFTF